ncbi:hypothetical protein [Desulfovibrio sp. JC022]|uniref:hypothetical protein n=1 Tax=Desulfovibrio sp. JC022 TaxID=2593642 RepID=UPI0013D0A959|nr:hypothetical protein [Desulfovibrio sp. JC022]
MFSDLSISKIKLPVLALGLLLCFFCVSCKTVDTSGEVSATVTSISGGSSK